MSTPASAQVSTIETRALTLSLVATTVLGGGAIVWGIVSGAGVILFDGVYMMAGIVLVGVSLLASRAARSAASKDYPFGRHAATPLAVALQGAALLGTLLYGAADAIAVLIAGGSDASGLTVLLYGVVSALASVVVMLLLRGPARVSALAKAEVVSWRAGALLSVVVALGGTVALLLTATGAKVAAAFVDPVLVLIACALITPMAIALLREGGRELLEAAPAGELRDRIEAAVSDGARSGAPAGHVLPEPIIRATKLGQRLYVEVDFVVASHEWTVDEEDAIRRAITTRLDGLGHRVWATVELTTDPDLAAA